LEDTHINLMGIHDNEAIFLTQEEQELFLLNQTKVSRETEGAGQPTWEDDILEVHRQYNLRGKKAEGNSPRKTTVTQKAAEPKKLLRKPLLESLPRKVKLIHLRRKTSPY
jgi:hypothetical protein